MATARALVEGAGLSYRAAAARTALREETIGKWARRFGWRRVGAGPSRHCERSEATQGRHRRERGPWVASSASPPRNDGSLPSPVRADARRPYRYPPELREAARGRIEGTRMGLERIGLELGVARSTLYGWQRLFGWQRPAPEAKVGPDFFRSRKLGRAYGADAVGTARDLVAGSSLPLRRIAARAGISRATLCRWMTRPGWTRSPAAPRGGGRAPYGPEVVAAAAELYRTTHLSEAVIAARVKATPERIVHWARRHAWTRPPALPSPARIGAVATQDGRSFRLRQAA